jgi:hypothetical protein
VYDLGAGMDAAVGPAGGRCPDWSAGDRRERRLERVLYAAAARLGLPAQETAAVVFEA